MRAKLKIFAITSMLASTAAIAAPDHLEAPEVYDNWDPRPIWGQTFTAESTRVAGISWYIGDPTRASEETVNGLKGSADLLLFDASDLSHPIEIARSSVYGAGDNALGIFRFEFSNPVTTAIGATYFIALDVQDKFGVGLRSQAISTYDGGSEAKIVGSELVLYPSGRDTAFRIHTSPVPEPETYILMLIGFALLGVKQKMYIPRIERHHRDA